MSFLRVWERWKAVSTGPGWRRTAIVVHDVPDRSAAAEVVGSLGDLVPQYNGLLTHEVTYRPGNDHRAYSQSANTILAHTEAPGWNPSPAYPGTGRAHPDDGRRTDLPGPGRRLRTAMLGADDTGRTALRFSYNLLTAADYDPHHDSDVDDSRLPLGRAGRRLAHRVSDLFHELRTRVLIPENALLIWDNQRMLHARSEYADRTRHLTRFWAGDRTRA
ncbi:TauD/TfdA family dioxygenase [Rhodococcus opacus]|uniref:TauD/TfdA family dioxygenase n=1 Tax=Rhodococcus opacus TaxID=37919 RepID=UPI002954C6F7|nr:TauD/TfdA family dioxygenase [Rhodococcus opacus]MDV7085538.1 TauD/TfdA family dioxygenase [Rhodococcus opacus]